LTNGHRPGISGGWLLAAVVVLLAAAVGAVFVGGHYLSNPPAYSANGALATTSSCGQDHGKPSQMPAQLSLIVDLAPTPTKSFRQHACGQDVPVDVKAGFHLTVTPVGAHRVVVNWKSPVKVEWRELEVVYVNGNKGPGFRLQPDQSSATIQIPKGLRLQEVTVWAFDANLPPAIVPASPN
jgi:hypothetical protein